MDIAAYAIEADVEENHWWFVGRRKLFKSELLRGHVSRDCRVLDVGTGTGSNLRMLRDLGFGHVVGLDASEEAIRYCALKGLGPVRKGDICALPFADASFEFVLATDVIEHVDDHKRAVAEIARVLTSDGRALITVPAFQSLWGAQDRQAFHKRRYRMHRLIEVLQSSGMQIERSYYFNYLLFAPIWIVRRSSELFGFDLKNENWVNTPLLNRVLSLVFALDISTAERFRVPFGVSILAVITK